MSDNYNFTVRAEGPTGGYLKPLLLSDKEYSSMTASGYLIDEYERAARLVFFKYNYDKANPLPFKMDAEDLGPFIDKWLLSVDYPSEPDQDGHNEKGWLLTNGNMWGHVDGYDYHSLFSIQPDWQMYGK